MGGRGAGDGSGGRHAGEEIPAGGGGGDPSVEGRGRKRPVAARMEGEGGAGWRVGGREGGREREGAINEG